MAVVDAIYAKTKTQVASGIEEKTAIGLKKMWPQIKLAASQLDTPVVLPEDPTAHLTYPENATDAEKQSMQNDVWMQMSRNLIDSKEPREVVVIDKDGNPIKIPLSELDKLLTTEMKESIGVDSVDEMIPTRVEVDLISENVASSVRGQAGTGIGFLDNMLGGASLGDVFMGLISWIFSGFDGGFTGLKETIADRTGARMEQSVVNDLTGLKRSLARTENDISGFMTEEAIRGVGVAVGDAPRASLSGAAAKPGDALTDVKMGEFENDMRAVVANKIEQNIATQMDTAFKSNSHLKELYEADTYTDAVKKAAGYSAKHHKLDALKDVRIGVSEKVASIITDPEYVYQGDEKNLASEKGKALRDMDPKMRALAIADETRSVIRELGAASKKAGKGIDSFYALLEQTVPAEIQGAILAQDEKGKIPWFIAGKIGDVVRSDAAGAGAGDDTLTVDPETRALAAQELVVKLQQQMKDTLYPGGVPSEEAKKIALVAGAPLEDRHLGVVAEALAPAMLGLKDSQPIQDAIASGDEGKQTQALEEISKTFSVALKAKLTKLNDPVDPANPDAARVALSEEAVDLLAMRMADTYARAELGMKTTPAGFAAKMQEQEGLIAQSMVSQGLRAELSAPSTQNLLKTANDGKAVNADAAVDAVKEVYAARVRDQERMAGMDDKEYRKMFDEARSALEAKRAHIGVADGKRGDAILDSMAYQMTTGVVKQALGDDAPEVPKRLQETKRVAEATLAEILIPEMVREQLVPLLDGTVSADDKTPNRDNGIIANVIAVDAARSGRQVRTSAVVDNVSKVVLYHQLKHNKDGQPVDEAEMKTHLLGALYDERTGLGEQTAKELASILAKQSKKAIENPNAPAPTAAEAASERHEQAFAMSSKMESEIASEVLKGLVKYNSRMHTPEIRVEISKLAASAMQNVALGNHTYNIDGTDYQFHQLNDDGQRAVLTEAVTSRINTRLKKNHYNFGYWIDKTAKNVSANMGAEIVPDRDADADVTHLHAGNSGYATAGKSEAEISARTTAEIAARTAQHREVRQQMAAFEALEGKIAEVSPATARKELEKMVALEREQDTRDAVTVAVKPSAAPSPDVPAAIPENMKRAVSAFKKGPSHDAVPSNGSVGMVPNMPVPSVGVSRDPVVPRTPDGKSDKDAPKGMQKPEAGSSVT